MKLKELRYIVSSTQMTKLLDMTVVGKLKHQHSSADGSHEHNYNFLNKECGQIG